MTGLTRKRQLSMVSWSIQHHLVASSRARAISGKVLLRDRLSGRSECFTICQYLYYVSLGIDYFEVVEDLDQEDLEELNRLAWRCSWLIMCDFHKIYEIKTIIDVVDPKTVYFVLDELRKIYPEKSDDVSDEDVFQDDFWHKKAEGIACSLTQEEKDRASALNITDYMMEKCEEIEGEEISEECQKLTDATEKNKDVMEKYKEQCMEVIAKEEEEELNPVPMM
ncbi:uncharacterized protein NPIL_521891 [Nephila pilipes]|uniref:Uncharacterized protein n=1 Tax=Nephila pilipes TaxID=299642 RepID=A0A8X6MZV4_NEPPI|nr:uncharacterized protein NPIL_521891 [Nephila pilipes]